MHYCPFFPQAWQEKSDNTNPCVDSWEQNSIKIEKEKVHLTITLKFVIINKNY